MVWYGMYYIYYMSFSLHTCNLILRLFHPRVVPFHSHFFLIVDQHMFKTKHTQPTMMALTSPAKELISSNFSFKKLTKKTSSNWAQDYRRPRIQDCSNREGGWLDVLDIPWENHWGWPAVMKRDDGLGSWTVGPNEVWALHLQPSFNSDKMD